MPPCRIESLGVSLPRRHLTRWGSVKHAVVAGRRCLAASHHTPAEVRVLINTGIHRDGHICEPAMACYIQHGLGINIEFQGRRTTSFDLANGGVGMLNAIQVLCALITSGQAHVGMVVSSEVNTDRHPDPAYPYPGSGAAVLLDLAPRSGAGFGTFAFRTFEEHAGLHTSHVSLVRKRGRLVMQRQSALEDVYLAGATVAVAEALARQGWRRDEVDLVVPAQISRSFLARLPEAIGVPRERVADLTSVLPDTHSTSTFLALHHVQTRRPFSPGARVLLLACGSGVTVGAATYTF